MSSTGEWFSGMDEQLVSEAQVVVGRAALPLVIEEIKGIKGVKESGGDNVPPVLGEIANILYESGIDLEEVDEKAKEIMKVVAKHFCGSNL